MATQRTTPTPTTNTSTNGVQMTSKRRSFFSFNIRYQIYFEMFLYYNSYFLQSKAILNNFCVFGELVFFVLWIPDSAFWIPDSGFQILVSGFRFPIPDSGFLVLGLPKSHTLYRPCKGVMPGAITQEIRRNGFHLSVVKPKPK